MGGVNNHREKGNVQALGIVSASKTVRNLPNPPAGAKIALMRPPTLFPLSNPASQAGSFVADAAKMAPKKCPVI